jgi:hypothetical protein
MNQSPARGSDSRSETGGRRRPAGSAGRGFASALGGTVGQDRSNMAMLPFSVVLHTYSWFFGFHPGQPGQPGHSVRHVRAVPGRTGHTPMGVSGLSGSGMSGFDSYRLPVESSRASSGRVSQIMVRPRALSSMPTSPSSRALVIARLKAFCLAAFLVSSSPSAKYSL